ncbi:hypothetical protein TNCV_4851481 [Trichonephila clavipes]|nr:hypothetical protein TNCV_4851481 [Trichonephila clavipes]
MPVQSVVAQTSSRWSGEEVRRRAASSDASVEYSSKIRLGGVVDLSLAICTQGCRMSKSMDFPNVEIRQRPCRMIIRHEKESLSVRLV